MVSPGRTPELILHYPMKDDYLYERPKHLGFDIDETMSHWKM